MANHVEDGQLSLESLEAAGWKVESEHHHVDITRIHKDGQKVTVREEVEPKSWGTDVQVTLAPQETKLEIAPANIKVFKKDISVPRSDTTNVTAVLVGTKNDQEVEFVGFRWQSTEDGREGIDQYIISDGKEYTNFSGWQSPGWGKQYPLPDVAHHHLLSFREAVQPQLAGSLFEFSVKLSDNWQAQSHQLAPEN